MQHLPDTASGTLPQGGGPGGCLAFGLLAILCPRGMHVCFYVCATCFFMGLTYFQMLMWTIFGEAPGEKEKVQNAVTPDGKYYAFVNEADVSPDSCL